MRKSFAVMLLSVMLLFPLAAFAQELTGCCTNSAGRQYPPNAIFGTSNHGCASNDVWVSVACDAVTPVPPTPVATAVPTPYTPPNEIKIPGWLQTIFSLFAPKIIVPFAALIASACITLTQVVKQLVALLGGHLSPKWVYVVNAFLSLLTTVGGFATAGYIQGSGWLVLLVAVLGFLGGILGYKVTFSDAAKAKLSA